MTADAAHAPIWDNRDARQYELHAGSETAVITYRLAPNRITFIHTRVPDALSGMGVAGRMAGYVLEDARARGLEVVPICPYVAGFIRRHPQYLDLVPPWARDRYLSGAAATDESEAQN
jgi:predicted GNAT family acetyltransferase